MNVPTHNLRVGVLVVLICSCIRTAVFATESATEGFSSTLQTTPPPSLRATLRTYINSLMQRSSGSLTRKLLQAELSSQCSVGLLQFLRGVRDVEPWALRLIDATAKYPTGLLQGTTADIGAYDECIETVVNDKYGHQMLRGQFCNFHVQMSESASVVEEMVPALMYSHPRVRSKIIYFSN